MNIHCSSGVHCRPCRTDEAQRKALNMPAICPHGITAANLPTPKPPPSQLDAALLSQARGEVYAPPGRCKGCGG
jgi:hypothetical protein